MFLELSPAKRRFLVVISMICLFSWIAAGVEITSARYRTEKTGSVSVRVASFLVEAEGLTLLSADAVLDCNEADDRVEYAFTVRNRSEVAVSYNVSAFNVPDSLCFSAENGAGELAPNGAEREVRVSFQSADPSDRAQPTAIEGIVLQVTALQKGGEHE